MKALNNYIVEKLKIDKHCNIEKKDFYPIDENDKKALIRGRDIIIKYLNDHSFFNSYMSDFKIGKTLDKSLVLDLSRNDNAMDLFSEICRELCKELDCAAGFDKEKGIIEFIV